MDVKKAWNSKYEFVKFIDPQKNLPKAGEKNILITSALPYVNNVPHLGNIVGCVLSADVFSRYCRLKNWRSLYISGTDEYGTATETKAIKEGLTPREICDKYHKIHKTIYDWFNIEFDHFGRTTTAHQTELTQHFFMKLHQNGFTSTDTVNQLHCDACQRFLADRFVHGECPFCHFDDARGDQCDGCGKLINAIELVNPRCSACNASPVSKLSTHIFLNLDQLANEVEEHMNTQLNLSKNQWSPNAISIAKGWLKGGLEKRCITRDLKWGVPVPLPNFENKVFYVWFDAPIGYLSITKDLLREDWTKWWMDPGIVDLYNFLGKDNVAFHAVMFPAVQLGTREKLTIVNHICATEYLNYENAKFSKSRGTGVFGDMAANTGIESDIWRFYLLYMRPESQDSSFCWDDFALKVNAELLNNLGNFVNRALSFLSNNFKGYVPEMRLTDVELSLFEEISTDLAEFDKLLGATKLRDGISKVLSISRRGNLYMQSMQPWVLIKGDEAERERAGTVIGVASNIAYLLSVMLYPYMPDTSAKIRSQCALPKLPVLPLMPICYLKVDHLISQPKPLFAKIEKDAVERFKKQFGGDSDGNAGENQQLISKQRSRNAKTTKEHTRNGDGTKDHCDESSVNAVAKDMKSVCAYPKLAANKHKIDALLKVASAKFSQKCDLFEKEKLAELQSRKGELLQEIQSLKTKLISLEVDGGIKQVENIPKSKESTKKDSNKPMNATDNPKDTVVEKAPAKESKGKKSDVEKVKKVDGKKGGGDDIIDVGRLDLRVGRIIDVQRHPDADSLYVEQIDLGEETPRTVISGLVKHFSIDEMQNRLVICVCNLKASKMRGIESQAMVLCASTPEKVEILSMKQPCVPGQRVSCEGFASRPDAVLNPKKKIWEGVAVDLGVDSAGQAVYRGHPLLVDGKVPMHAETLRNVPVK